MSMRPGSKRTLGVTTASLLGTSSTTAPAAQDEDESPQRRHVVTAVVQRHDGKVLVVKRSDKVGLARTSTVSTAAADAPKPEEFSTVVPVCLRLLCSHRTRCHIGSSYTRSGMQLYWQSTPVPLRLVSTGCLVLKQPMIACMARSSSLELCKSRS
jgi:hypothetical protein